jgi:hypothetical protein
LNASHSHNREYPDPRRRPPWRKHPVPAGKTSPWVPQEVSRHRGSVTLLGFPSHPRTNFHEGWFATLGSTFSAKYLSLTPAHNECTAHASIPHHPGADSGLPGNCRRMRHRVEDRGPHRAASADGEDRGRPSPFSPDCLGQPSNSGSNSDPYPASPFDRADCGNSTSCPSRPLGLRRHSGRPAPAGPSSRRGATDPRWTG